MKKPARDLLFLALTGAMTAASFASIVTPLVFVRAKPGPMQPLERVTVVEPDSPEIIEQRRLVEERAAQQSELYQKRRYFIETWGARIDEFNEGWPLEGYGVDFAKAAYDNGIDPRFSPAIARVESGSGRDCFVPYNAWGWHGSEWSDWKTAISEYTQLLAENYGYTLSYAGASYYNNVSTDLWYAQVAGCMYQIWPTDEL